MTTRIILHEMEKDRILSLKESKRMIESFWEFCHKDCCGSNVSYHQKELWFCECHAEHDDNETSCDTVEWIWEITFMGVTL